MRFRTTLLALALPGIVAGCADTTAPANPSAALVDPAAPSLSLAAGTGAAGPLVSKAASSFCADVKGMSTVPGAIIQLYTCTASQTNQQFLWKSDSTIHAYSGGSLCLDDAGGKGNDGDRIITSTCSGAATQKWNATTAGEIKGINGKCIAAPSTSNRVFLVLATCNGSALQHWDVTGQSTTAPAPPPPPTAGPVDYHAIAAGIRARGFGQGTYSLLSPVAGSRTLYVSPSGNDANAGTSSSAPFKTIAKAAQVARAGDVVTIASGTYGGSVVVANSGTSSAPIVFQAATRGGVVLRDGNASFQPAAWTGGVQETGQLYVTVRGLTFRHYAANAMAGPGPQFPAALKAAHGWRVEDCLFDSAGNTAVQIEGSYVTVTKTTIQYTYFEALSAWAHAGASSVTDATYVPLDGIQIVDAVLRGNYTLNQEPSSGGVADYSSKFMTTRGTLIDNMESYENNGPGFWFDTQNANMTVQNSYFHDNRNIPGTTSTGRGLNLEANWGPALIQRNVFVNNASVGLEVTATQGVTIHQNLFYGNTRCVEMTNDLSRAATFPLRNVGIYANQCGNWNNFAAMQTIGGAAAFTTPAAMKILADSNVYQPTTSSVFGWWENTAIGKAASIADFRNSWGWEAHGSTGTVNWP